MGSGPLNSRSRTENWTLALVLAFIVIPVAISVAVPVFYGFVAVWFVSIPLLLAGIYLLRQRRKRA